MKRKVLNGNAEKVNDGKQDTVSESVNDQVK